MHKFPKQSASWLPFTARGYGDDRWVMMSVEDSAICALSCDFCNIGSGINELKNLQFLPRAYESREVMVEDRTRAHADHVGYGLDRSTTAAVGILKAIHSPDEL